MHKFNIFLPNLHSIRLPVCVRFFLYLYIFIKNKFYGSRGASAENLVIQISLEYIKMASIHIAFYYKLASNHTLIKKKNCRLLGIFGRDNHSRLIPRAPPPPVTYYLPIWLAYGWRILMYQLTSSWLSLSNTYWWAVKNGGDGRGEVWWHLPTLLRNLCLWGAGIWQWKTWFLNVMSYLRDT